MTDHEVQPLPAVFVEWASERRRALAVESASEPALDVDAAVERLLAATVPAGSPLPWGGADTLDPKRTAKYVAGSIGRVVPAGRSWLLPRVESVADWFERRRMPAEAMVAASTVAAIASAALLLAGAHLAAALVLFVGGLTELVDASLARRAPAALRAVFLDYLSDRLSDIALLGALALSLRATDPIFAWIALGVLLGSLTSSYCRAQAVALRFVASTEFGRLERMTIILGGFWVSVVFPVAALQVTVVLLAMVVAMSLVERVALVWRRHPYAELGVHVEWEAGEFLPTLVDEASREGRRVMIVHGQGKEVGRMGGQLVAYIEPGTRSGTSCIRVLRDPLPFPEGASGRGRQATPRPDEAPRLR